MSQGAEVDWVVIGAGVVGAACANALVKSGASVLILDREGGPVELVGAL